MEQQKRHSLDYLKSLKLKKDDQQFGQRYGIYRPLMSERETLLAAEGCQWPKQMAYRQHLLALREQYPDRKEDIAQALRAQLAPKHKGGFQAPYTLD